MTSSRRRTPDLNNAILAAHAADDRRALTTLYATAAAGSSGQEIAFFLTQAYVFALDTGAPEAAQLHRALCALGADT